MELTVALDGEKKRDLRFFAGDDMSLTIVVYAHDGDVSPIAVTNVRFAAADGSLPMGSEFVVPSNFFGRVPYRIVGEVADITTTLAYGVMQTEGGWPSLFCWCAGPWPYGVVGKSENVTVLDKHQNFESPANVESALEELGDFKKTAGDLSHAVEDAQQAADEAAASASNAAATLAASAKTADLADPNKGAAIIARAAVSLSSIAELDSVIRDATLRYEVAAYSAGWAATVRGPLGGGRFLWDAASTATAIPGVIVAVAGVSTGRFRRIDDGDFTALSCGADPYGFVDSTAAIQATYDYLRKTIPIAGLNVGKVRLPRGEYLVNGTLNLSSLGGGYPRGAIFEGESGGGTTITRTVDTGDLFDVRIYLGLEFKDIYFRHTSVGARADWTANLFTLNGNGGGNRLRLTGLVTEGFARILNYTGTVGNQDTNYVRDCQFNNCKTFCYARGTSASQAVANSFRDTTWFGYIDKIFDISGYGNTRISDCNIVQSGDFLSIAAQGSGLASIFTCDNLRFEYWNGPAGVNANGTTRILVTEDSGTTVASVKLRNCAISTRADMDPSIYQFDIRGGTIKLEVDGGTWSGVKIRTKGRFIPEINGWGIVFKDLLNGPNPETDITREASTANASAHMPITFKNCRNISNITLRGPGNAFTAAKSAGTGDDRNRNTINGADGYLLRATTLNTKQTMSVPGYGSMQLVEKIRFFVQLSGAGSPTVELKAYKDAALTTQIGSTLTVSSYATPGMYEVAVPANTFTTEGVFLTAENTVGATATIFGLAYVDTLST